MTTPNDQTPGGEGTKAEAKAPEPEKKLEAAPEAKPEPKKEPETKKEPEAKVESKKLETAQLGEDDDEIPETAELIQLSKSALTKRLARHSKKELRDAFGTDDIAEIKSKLAKHDEYAAKAEEERRAQLTKEQKLQEDLEREKKRAEKAERELQSTVDRQAFAEYDQVAKGIFDKYFDDDPDTREFVESRLKKHVASLDDKDAPADPKKAEKVFDKWAKEYAEKHPKYAKKAPEEPKPEPKKIALNTGASPTKPEKGDPKAVTKTARPGQANTMSKAEYAAYKRQNGIAT